MPLQFVWDKRKATSNQRKHGISFEEAATVFSDPLSLAIEDPDHSEEEDRYLMLGFSYRLRVLVVSHSLRKNGSEIRIISARRATKKEQKVYFGERR